MYWAYSNMTEIARSFVQEEVPGLGFERLDAGWNRVELVGVKFTDAKGVERLSTKRIDVAPSMASLFSSKIEIGHVRIEGPTVLIEQMKNGELVLPIPEIEESSSETPPVRLGHFLIEGGQGEFVDHAANARFKIRDLKLELRDLAYPLADARLPIDFSATLEGKREGKIAIGGWVNPVSNDGDITISVTDLFVPLATPYLRSEKTNVTLTDGTVSLKMSLKMNQGRVVVPGEVTMANLKFAGGGKFFGVPTNTLKDFFETQNPSLTIPFEVEGSMDKPDEIRLKVVQVIARRMIEKLGAEQLKPAVEKLKQGDVEGAKEELNKLKKKFKLKF
jgi:hypothetical protein